MTPLKNVRSFPTFKFLLVLFKQLNLKIFLKDAREKLQNFIFSKNSFFRIGKMGAPENSEALFRIVISANKPFFAGNHADIHLKNLFFYRIGSQFAAPAVLQR